MPSRSTVGGRWVACALSCTLGMGASARAETPNKIDAQQFHPAATSSDYLGLDSATVLPSLRGAVGLTLSDGHDALVLRDQGVVPDGHIVEHQVWLEAMGSIGLFDRFEVGLALPIALYQGGDPSPAGYDVASAVRSQRGAGIGDLRLDGKVLLVDRLMRHTRLSLALIVGLTAPTSTSGLTGESNATGRPRLVLEWGSSRVHLVATFGAIFRARAEVLGIDIEHQLTWGVGGIVRIWRGIEAQAEFRGAVGIVSPPGYHVSALDAPAEFDVGLAYRFALGLRAYLAGGLALDRGYGAPQFRVFAGARYTIPAIRRELPWGQQDADRDGILNADDRCMREAGPAANGGCPDTDFDGDGVIDRLDRCPDRAGSPADNGCPESDSDGDGVPDRVDHCPNTPGPEATWGCPLLDSDGDGVSDKVDRCPDKAGPSDNEGCPDVDSDGDGLVDRLDNCPAAKEVYNGVSDDDGCPDQGKALVTMAGTQITMLEPIVFEREGDAEKIALRSTKVLGALASLLRAHKELTKLRIDGHTDDRGDAVDNLDLSLKRAQLVRRWLVEDGRLDARRLSAQGFGADRPLGENATPQGRARNRRIEITVLESSP